MFIEDAFAGVCESPASAGASQYTHYVGIVYELVGTLPNCTFAADLNSAAESAFGANADDMVVMIEAFDTTRRLRSGSQITRQL